MSGPTETSSEIESELLAEVHQELERRGTTVIEPEPDTTYDLLASLVVTAILACLGVLAGTGVMMALTYTPTVEDASASTAWFQSGALGSIVRGAHYHASNLLVLLGAAYLAYMVWRGLFRKPNQWRWWRGAILLGLVLAFGLSGMLLPYDQLALHGTSIRLGYLADTPVIGEQLRSLAQGGDTIGNATLARFFGMHVIVLPALTLMLLRWLWQDGKTEGAMGAQVGVAAGVAVIVFAVGVLMPAPLGLHGDLSEPFPEARPEWYALPLYEMLKLMPPGALYVATLFVPPLLGALVVVGLPFIETASDQPARLLKPLRIGMLVVIVAGGVLAVLPLVEDMSDNAGYFKDYTVDEVMTAMGKRNERLLNSNEALPGETHLLARDMQLLHERLAGNYPEKIKDEQMTDWDKWASQGAELSRKLLLAADAETQVKLRMQLRETCQQCHDEHEEEVELNPAPRLAATQETPDEVEDPPEQKFFFDQQRLKELPPSEFTRTTSTGKMMDQLKYRLRDILIHTGIREGDPRWDREQSIVDLLALCDIVEKLYEKNEAEYPEQEKWNEWIELMRTRVNEVAQAEDDVGVVRKLKDVGKVCEDCHDNAFEPLEPVEWTFNRMLQD